MLRNMKLSVKLPLLIILLALVLVSLVISLAIATVRDGITETENESNTNNVNSYSSTVTFYLDESRSVMEITAGDVALALSRDIPSTSLPREINQGEAHARVHVISESILEHSESFEYIMLLNEDGSVNSLSPHEMVDKMTRKDMAFTSWYKDLVKSGKTITSDLHISVVTNRPSVVVATPAISPEGKILGYWAGGLHLDQLSKLGTQLAAEDSLRSYGFITDRRGLVVAHQSNPTYVENQTDFSSTPPVQAALSGKRGTMHFTSTIDDIEKLAAYMPLPNTNWVVVYQVPVKDAFKHLDTMVGYLIGLGVLLIILMGLGGALITHQATKPLGQLTAAAIEVGKGDLSQRIQVKSRDEIGQLGTEFNRMAVSLKEQIGQREKAESDRIKAEAGAASAKLAKTMIDSMMDAVIMTELDGRIIQFNKATTDMFGYGDDILGQRPTALVIDSDTPTVSAVIKETMEKGFASNREHTGITKEGKEFPVLVSAAIVTDIEGKPTGIIGVVKDVTYLRRAEGEMKLRAKLLDSASDTIMMHSLDGKIIYANETAWKVHGYSHEEFIGLTIKDIVTDKQGEEFPGRTELLIKTGKQVFESLHRRKNGSEIPMEIIAQVIDISGQKAILSVQRDITERKLAEDSLRETNEYLENLINCANAPIIVWDPRFLITRFNRAFENLTGRNSSEVIGKSLEILFPSAKVQSSMERINETLTGARWQAVEIDILHLDGHSSTVIWNSAPIFAHDQKTLVATIAQGQDITELKIKQADLERSNAELERFAYVASHDLQEPLRMVSSYTQLLEKRYKDKLDADANDFIHYAVDGAKRMQNLINDLLIYSRVGSRGKPFENTYCEQVYDIALDNVSAAIHESGASITHDPLPAVMGDQGQLVQLFQNLLGNAIKFKDNQSPKVHVSAKPEGDHWIFSVQDNGIGIDPQYFDRVFIIFQRLGGNNYQGTGIGLAVAKRIVERHGGRIWIESKIGEGSTFYFTLPKKEE
jgi:PAS domain S-box-containing protein